MWICKFGKVATTVMECGFANLAEVYQAAFPNNVYQSHSAKCKVLQVALVALTIGMPASGLSSLSCGIQTYG